MKNIKNISWFNKYIEIVEKSGLPVDNLESINRNGEFTIEECFGCDDLSKYTGKIVNNGLIAMEYSERGYLWDMDSYDVNYFNSLIVYNVEGYSFSACTRNNNFEENFNKRLNGNELKIKTLYLHYKDIIEALKNGASDEFIKEAFKLDSFNSKLANSKTNSYSKKV